jgi:H+/Cl- antiporter ClcA
MVGGALAGMGWWMLRRRHDVPRMGKVVSGRDQVPRLRLSIDAALQMVLVGSGASLGRKALRASSPQR